MSDYPKSKEKFQHCSTKITDFLSNILILLVSITAAILIVYANAFFKFLDDAWDPIFAVLSRCHVIEPNLPIDSADRFLPTYSVPLLLLGAVQSILIRSKKQLRWVLLLSCVVSFFYSNASETTEWTYLFIMLSVAGLLISGFLASRWMGGRWQAELATISCARAVTILIIRSTKLLALVGCAYLVVLSVADITTPPPRPPAGPGPPPSVLLEEEFDSSPYPTEESPKGLSSPPKDQTAVNKGTGGISALIAGKVLSWGRRLLIPLAFGGLLWGLERRLVRQSKALT